MKTPVLVLALLGSAQAVCDTSYLYPPGTFSYQSPDLGNMTVRNVVTASSITSTTTLDGDSSTNTLTCQGNQLKVTSGKQKVSLDLSTFPQGGQWHPGYRWTFVTRAVQTGLDLTTQSVGKVIDQETLTTPAGTFNTYRVEMTTTLNISGATASKLPKAALAKMQAPVKMTVWFARGVGIVKQSGVVSRTLVKVSH